MLATLIVNKTKDSEEKTERERRIIRWSKLTKKKEGQNGREEKEQKKRSMLWWQLPEGHQVAKQKEKQKQVA